MKKAVQERRPNGLGISKTPLPVSWKTAAILGISALFLVAVLLALVSITVGGLPALSPASGIAVIPLKGEISNEGSGVLGGAAAPTANDIVALIDEAENDGSIGAIFIDIDSPGGEVVASKQIAYRLREAEKPVYSYINSVGASGAYYVAAASDYIMSDEDSITGSIGVVSISYNLEGLLEKIGVRANVFKVGEHKDMGSPFREMTYDENVLLMEILAQAYEGFRGDILEFRGGSLTAASLDRVADGRILTGRQAKQSGLVDELLTRSAAIERAAELAGIKEPELVHYGMRPPSIYDILFASGRSFGTGLVSSIGAEGQPPKIR